MMTDRIKNALSNYADHPEFIGISLISPNQEGHTSETPLHVAARVGSLEDVLIFLNGGGIVNARGDCGNAPLHEAAMRGNEAVVSALLKYAADVSIKNDFGQTPLRVAEIAGMGNVVEMLR